MAYVICEPCVGTKDTRCRDVCPVDAIVEMDDHLVIVPELCVDCGACVPACPVSAIFALDDVPTYWRKYTHAPDDIPKE